MTEPDDKPCTHVILASIREGRAGEKVARWFLRLAEAREDMAVELVDLKNWPLPLYSHAESPKLIETKYPLALEREWVETVKRADGYVVVTPEYNFGYPPSLKNALDYAYAAWNRKPIAFVSYGDPGAGVRSVQQLRVVAAELQMASVRSEVNIPFVARAFDEHGEIIDPFQVKRARALLDDLAWWTTVLREGRRTRPLAR